MEMLRALKNLIFETATASADLTALVGTRIFDTTVPPGIEPPWVRYYVVAVGEENVFRLRPPVASRIRVTFDVVSASQVATEAENILEALTSAFDSLAGTKDTWVFAFKRDSKRKVFDEEARAWTLSVEYLVTGHPLA